jgi:hypothetical protein
MGSALGIARGTRRALENMARSGAASGSEGEGRIVARDNRRDWLSGELRKFAMLSVELYIRGV